MKALPTFLSALLLLSSAAAQNLYSPLQSYGTKEGERSTSIPFTRHKARQQFGDGSLRNASRGIKNVAIRPDGDRQHVSQTSQGRTWSTCRVRIGEFDMSKMQKDPNKNLGVATLVFSSSLTLPTLQGFPSSSPAPWIVVPFRQSFAYTGKQDLLTDWVLDGGVLKNSAQWTGTTPRSYPIDTYYYGTRDVGVRHYFGAAGNAGCPDKGNTAPYDKRGAYFDAYVDHYGPSYQVTSLRNRVRIYYYALYVGKNRSSITALTFKGTVAGTPFPGIACNKLHVDLGSPAQYFARQTTSSTNGAYGQIPQTHLTAAKEPYTRVNPSWIGLPFWLQAAWDDSSTGRIKLTTAVRTAIPAMPPYTSYQQVPRNGTTEIYPTSGAPLQWDPGPFSDRNPILRYGL